MRVAKRGEDDDDEDEAGNVFSYSKETSTGTEEEGERWHRGSFC